MCLFITREELIIVLITEFVLTKAQLELQNFLT
jgi:hypothetical protein